jgi:hypothetical protein
MDKATSLEELALAFVIALRLAGHEPKVDNGHFCIRLNVRAPTRKTYDTWLGFDPKPFDRLLLEDKERFAKLIAATREVETATGQEAGQ